MASLTEGQHAGEFILAEPDQYISREIVTVTVPTGGLEAGAVLGQLSATSKYVPYDNAETDGRETAAGILVGNLPDAGDATAAIVARLASVRRDDLQYLTGTSAGNKTAAEVELLARFITVRD